MNRPSYNDPEVIAGAAAAILDDVWNWTDWTREGTTKEELLEDLKQCFARDGFEYAERLKDRAGWMGVNAELVDILDNACHAESDAYRALVEKWVVGYGVKPGRSVGDAVKWREHNGTITKVDTQRGQYVVNVPALGHVLEGLGTHGEYVDWENIDGTLTITGLTIPGPLFGQEVHACYPVGTNGLPEGA